MKTKLLLPLMLLSVLSLPAKVLAHAVETNYLLTDKLEFRSTYSTGEALENAEVRVYAPNNPDEPWMVGRTDATGYFGFQPDTSIPGDWTVDIGEGGHADILTVPVTEAGIDPNQISQLDSSDIHYAESSELAIASGALALVGIAVVGGSVWRRVRE